jgi:DNA-binding CsgD family transcriptional regulator
MRALGLAALAAHDAERAVESLLAVWEHCRREHIDDPGAVPVAADLVEALVAAGRIDEARAVTERLERLAGEQEHPWGLAGAARCRAVIAFATATDTDQAGRDLAHAAQRYRELGLCFDAGRSLLALGRAQRRLRRWGAARRALDEAAAVFDELGCVGWAAEARAETRRLAGRKAASVDGLTPTERRIAELAAAGLSNKQIARTVVVSVNTVERHLSRAYAKLGVRSRTQLSARLAAGSAPQ